MLIFNLLISYVQDRKKTLPYFPRPIVSHISTVSETVLPDVQFQPYRFCTVLFDTVFHLHPLHHSQDFLFYICRQIQPMAQHNTVLASRGKCVRTLLTVGHCIRLRSTMDIVKDSLASIKHRLFRQYIFF